jgi:hypothetical protein
VKKLLIFGDNDENYYGHKSAYSLANRLYEKNDMSVQVLIPDNTNEDWLDVLNKRMI